MKTISHNKVMEFKSEAINKQPLRIKGTMSELDLVGYDQVELKGMGLKMTKTAREHIWKILHIHKSMDKLLADTVGEKNRDTFINTIRKAKVTDGANNAKLLFLVDHQNQLLKGVVKDEIQLLGNDTFFSLAEVIIDKYGLDVTGLSLGDEGQVNINAIHRNKFWEIGNLKDETFNGGVSISNDYQGGMQLSSFLNRLVCSNGLIATKFSDTFKMTKMNPKNVHQFYSSVKNLAARDFKPVGFSEKVIKAHHTPASLREMESASKFLTTLSGVRDSGLEKWVPLLATENRFREHGVRTGKLSAAKKKNARTGTTVWELVNGMTHFATHDNGIHLNQIKRDEIQIRAGELLCKDYDMNNMVESPF